MFYEISNVVFNHKPTVRERRYRNPFSKTNKNTKQVYLVKDNPQDLFKAYSLGHCLRPHPFKDAKFADVNAIVLDFDNLTQLQYKFAKFIANHNFKDGICGDDSAGMKTWRKDSEGIEGATPKHWKFKVFYPTSCLCVYDEIYDAFLEAVSLFNPLRTMDEVEKVWAMWVKANNRSIYFKHDKVVGGIVVHHEGDFDPNHPKLTIEDPIFKDWILPDVTMLNSFRTQVTFGVDPYQVEKIRVMDDDHFFKIRHILVGASRVDVSKGIDDYEGLDWKVEFDTKYGKAKELEEARRDVVKKILIDTIQSMKTTTNDGALETPLSKSDFAKKIGKNKFEDLVIDESESKLVASWWYGGTMYMSRHGTPPPPTKFCEASQYAKRIAKCLVHNVEEYFHQTNNTNGVFNQIVEMVCRDIVRLFKLRCGSNVFGRYQDEKGVWRDAIDARQMGKFVYKVVNAISTSILGHGNWRMLKKLELSKHPLAESYLQYLRKYHETKDPKYFGMFNDERKRVLKGRIEGMELVATPYTRIPRAAKKLLSQHIRQNFKPIKDLMEFVKVSRRWLKKMGIEVDDDRLVLWFKDYRRSLNLTRKGEAHSSKWSRMFEGKSRDEISNIIDEIESKQMRYSLRAKYLRQAS